MAAKRRPPIQNKDLKGLKYFKLLGSLLERLHDDASARDHAGNRRLFYDQYACLLLLFFFNPVVQSLRGIQQASELDKVQRLFGCRRVSRGALSEAGRVFDPQLLHALIGDVAGQTLPLVHGKEAEALRGLTAVDGSLLPALPKMAWALWLKCILGCRHLLANSRDGVTIQVYLAIIASLLISLWAGRKPTVRTLEMIQFYFQGWATEEELMAHLDNLKPLAE